MSEEFDPYRKWLGIAPHELPAHHYRLLGIAPFEDDPDVIENAADRQMAHVRTYQNGKHRDFSQRILNELSAAKMVLLDGEGKLAYDAWLHEVIFAPEESPEPALPPGPMLPPVPVPPPPRPAGSGPPMGSNAPLPIGQAMPAGGSPVALPSKPRTSSKARARKNNSSMPIVLGCAAVGIALVAAVVFALSQSNKRPPHETVHKPTPAPVEPIKKHNPAKKAERPERVAVEPLNTKPVRVEPVKPEDQTPEQKFQAALDQAREHLAERHYDKVKDALSAAEAAKTKDEDGAAVEHLRRLHAHLDNFWSAVHEAVTNRMQAGDVFEYGGEEVELVKREGPKVTLKSLKDEHTSKIENVRPQEAALLARKALDKNPKSLLCIAAFWIVDSKAKARKTGHERAEKLWVDAAEHGYKDPAIAQELGLTSEFIANVKVTSTSEGLPKLEKPGDDPKPEKPTKEPVEDTPVVQQALPTMDQLRQAKQQFAERYAERVAKAKKNLPAYELLLTELEADAAKQKDPALQYVMYEEACEAAVTTLRSDALLRLLEEITKRWEVDGLRVRQQWLAKARPLSSPATDNFADAAAALAKEAEAAERWDVAIAAANNSIRVGEKVKGRDQKELVRKAREWEAKVDAAEKAKAASAALAGDPSDATAHLHVGRYLCYFQRDWSAGLPHLAQCNIEEEKAAATEDLTNPTNPTLQVSLGERWQALAKRKSGPPRGAVLERAKHWLEQALPKLDAEAREAAESRLKDIAKDLEPMAGA
jgi:hypothetical protein